MTPKPPRELHVIYVPGIGDDNPTFQRKAVDTWRWWGVEAELFQMVWSDSRTWDEKFQALLQRIDELTAQGTNVALVGASAGAGAVINAYAARKDAIIGVVCIAGKVNRPQAIGQKYRQHDPSFLGSAMQVPQSLGQLNDSDRRRILSRYGIADELVTKADSFIPGARNRRVLTFEHVLTIAVQLIFGAPSFIRFLKKLNANPKLAES